jgi:hypothetical protein
VVLTPICIAKGKVAQMCWGDKNATGVGNGDGIGSVSGNGKGS